MENADEIRRDLEWVQRAITSLEENIEWFSSQQASIENVTKYSSSLSNRFNELQARLGMLETNKPTALTNFIGQWVYLANRIATHVPMQRSYLLSDSTYVELDKLRREEPIKGWLDKDSGGRPITIATNELPAAIGALKQYMEKATGFLQTLAGLDGEAAGEVANFRDYIQKANGLKGELLAYKGALTSLSEKSARRSQIKQSSTIVIWSIGCLCLFAMLLIRYLPGPAVLIWIESGQMIQFITVMILLSTILVLGLADTLKENTLGTLLGGIGGYVLSQGVGRAAARQAVRQMEERNKRDLGKAD